MNLRVVNVTVEVQELVYETEGDCYNIQRYTVYVLRWRYTYFVHTSYIFYSMRGDRVNI